MRYDLNDVYLHLGQVEEVIHDTKVSKKKKTRKKKKIGGTCNHIDKIICFVYSSIMDFCETDKVKGIPILEKFIENVKGILYNEIHIHNSHITGDNNWLQSQLL